MNMTFHEIQLEINRKDAAIKRMERNLEQARKLVSSLKELQSRREPK